MPRFHSLCAVLLSLCLCSCDSRKDVTGRYEVSGTVSFREGGWNDKSELKDVQLVIIADAFDSDRLYVDFDCGLSAKMTDSDSFEFESKTCPSYTQGECTFMWSFKSGQGTLKETEPVLDVHPTGVIKARCSNGASGLLSFWFNLTGVRKSEPSADASPGAESRDTGSSQMSTLRATLEQAVRSRLQ